MNASTLRSALLAKLAPSFFCIDSLATGPTQDQLQIFRSNPELNRDSLSNCNTFLKTMIGDFNAKSTPWCKIDKASFEGSQLNF